MDRQLAFVTPPWARGWLRWLVFSPGARIAAYLVALVLFVLLAGTLLRAWSPPAHSAAAAAVDFGFRALLPLIPYLLLLRLVEQRRPRELDWRRLLPDTAIGFAGGALLFSAVVGALWLLGSYHVLGAQGAPGWARDLLVVGFGAAIGEEIVFRGVLYRMVEEGLGTWAALAFSALLFGALHLGNPNATPWAGAAIAIEAGLLLALVYLVTRSLWTCIGLHAAWNFTQGTVYGIPVSGVTAHGWLRSTRTGPDWLSGASFGAEASVVALALCLLVSAVLLRHAIGHGLIVPPPWRRHPAAASLPGNRAAG